mmetsp:Transcript_84204/g.168085  ORF Transcript_84204/g.168085 Transcript_84204/m.168085 type:complete len:259 (+) Transcript_84204:160-936(+)
MTCMADKTTDQLRADRPATVSRDADACPERPLCTRTRTHTCHISATPFRRPPTPSCNIEHHQAHAPVCRSARVQAAHDCVHLQSPPIQSSNLLSTKLHPRRQLRGADTCAGSLVTRSAMEELARAEEPLRREVGRVRQNARHLALGDAEPLGEALPRSFPRRGGQQPPVAPDVDLRVRVEVRWKLAEHLAALDVAAKEHVVACPRMVCACPIRAKRAPKVGRSEHRDLVPHALCLHLRHEGGQRAVDLGKLLLHILLQ